MNMTATDINASLQNMMLEYDVVPAADLHQRDGYPCVLHKFQLTIKK